MNKGYTPYRDGMRKLLTVASPFLLSMMSLNLVQGRHCTAQEAARAEHQVVIKEGYQTNGSSIFYMTGSGRYWFIAFVILYGVKKDAVAPVLDGRPVILEELEEALQDWPNMLIGEATRLHGL